MTSQWAVDMIQKIRLTCGAGGSGNCNYCQKELEKVVMEIDEMRTNLRDVAREIITTRI